ncbi:MAG TPA: VOC family protein [Myxococcota bacterium]|nr:VOC family protein [Myxococcota bacterium]
MALHRLSRIEIGVPDGALAATCGFYRDFGLAEIAGARFATADGGEQLAFVAAPRRTLRALTVGVDDADDLERAAAALAKLGIACERSAKSLNATEPVTGVRAELALEPRVKQAASAPLATNGPGRVARVNARSPAAFAPAEQPRPRKLSHVVTTSTDPTASRRFFVEGLGFRVSDEIASIGAAFLRCSNDHHNLLVQPGPFAFVHHTAWEMDDVDAVGAAAAAMVADDPSRHAWGLGRHAIGSNYFWYLRDPAGNFAEYTSDLDVIVDEEAWRVASSLPVAGLAAWGPPVPRDFLAPDDVVALARGAS